MTITPVLNLSLEPPTGLWAVIPHGEGTAQDHPLASCVMWPVHPIGAALATSTWPQNHPDLPQACSPPSWHARWGLSSKRPVGLGVSSPLPLTWVPLTGPSHPTQGCSSVSRSVPPSHLASPLPPTPCVSGRPRMSCTTSCPSCTPSTRSWRPA